MSHYLDRALMNERLGDGPWHDVDVAPSIGSTNDELEANPRAWRALVTDNQTAGRGRLDRAWVAEPGQSIAMSATLPLPTDATRWGWVPLLVGVAVRHAIRNLAGIDVSLKWPNDVLARSGPGEEWHKLAGILCNATGGPEPVVVVGIGINVHQARAQLPVSSATSLAVCGAQVLCEDLVVELLHQLARVQRLWDTPELDDSYRASCLTIGQEVRVELAGDEVAAGRALDVDPMGRLVVATEEGPVPHAAGDVVHVRPRQEQSLVPDPSALDRAAFVDLLEERLIGAPRTLRRAEVAAAAEVSPETTAQMWRALGFVNARDEDVVFTEKDVEAMRAVTEIVQNRELDETTAVGLARAIGRSTDRMAMWALQLITDMVNGDQGMGVDSQVAQLSAERTVELADELAPLVDYAWRRNLAVAISRMIADSEPESHVGVVRTIGFADLVNFTQLVRQLSERELAALVQRFEALASDVVSNWGGAIVKTVGDEVLFSHTTVEGAVGIAFDLLDLAAADDLIPRMRVGLATGRVLARLGDVYGTTVNRASRLTGAAAPGTVLVDQDVAAAVRGRGDVRATAREALQLPGLGQMAPWVLSKTGGELLSPP